MGSGCRVFGSLTQIKRPLDCLSNVDTTAMIASWFDLSFFDPQVLLGEALRPPTGRSAAPLLILVLHESRAFWLDVFTCLRPGSPCSSARSRRHAVA